MTSAKINKELGQLLNVDDMFEPSEPIEYSMENTREPIEYIIENTRKPTVSPVQEKSENLFLSPSSVIESPLLPEDSGEVAGNAIYCDAGNLNEILNFDFNICKYLNFGNYNINADRNTLKKILYFSRPANYKNRGLMRTN